MTQISLTLQTVTPMFLAGAEPRGEPELRAPAFRGAMRYWLRAALGGAMGDQDAQRIFEQESKVFGSAADENSRASAVNVQLFWNSQTRPEKFQPDKPETFTLNGEKKYRPSGRDYLYYSMNESRRGAHDQRQYFPPQKEFTLKLSSRVGNQDENSYCQAVAALWLLIHLGGIGSRSRRTAGSISTAAPIKINGRESTEFKGLGFALNANNMDEAASSLSAGLKQARELIGGQNKIAITSPTEFDVLHPQSCKIWILGIWDSSESAVTKIGKALRDFRIYTKHDHDAVARWLKGATIDTVERSAFGLPLTFQYSNLRFETGDKLKGTVQGRLKKPALDRRASPLWLKVTRTVEGNYVGIATLFESRFLPKNEELNIKIDDKVKLDYQIPPVKPPEDYQIIHNWIAEKFSGAREVLYA